jgi:hypothetical protein
VCGLSAAQDYRVELANALGIGEKADRDDLPAPDGEPV